MRIKTILSIAAFSTAFIFSAAFAGLFIDKSENQSSPIIGSGYNRKPTSCFKNGNKGATAEKITAILEQDDRNGVILDRKLYQIDGFYISPFKSSSFEQYADATSEYADESGSIEDDRLPQEFQTAWRAHIKAWRDYADFLENTKSAAVRTEMGEKTFETMSNKYNTNINLTWYAVLHLAAKNGSDFKPKY
ncbi:MAG TPA: hypothetical protein VNI84_18890 [Pyrinomonadaceae bacterium]|nr:hypothetical protein [Pyrinomonadaceae bacterium]